MNEWRYLNLAGTAAKREAEDQRGFAVGAVAIRKDGTLVKSRNGAAQSIIYTNHAERRVLQKAGRGSVVFVARVIGDGSFKIARPCGRCQAALRAMKVNRCYYTINNNEFGVMDFV